MMHGFLTVFVALCLFDFSSSASVKKGLAMSMTNYHCGDLDVLTGIHWWYTWSMKPQKVLNCDDSREGFIPMKFKWYRKHGNLRLSSPSDQIILGFNEPNHEKQANILPKVAAEDWLALQEQAGNKTLVSPAVAPGGYMDPIDWLKDFFKFCDNQCKVHYIAVHVYFCDADKTMEFIKKVYNEFENKKIWLTEFACPHTSNETIQLEFMKKILPKLEKSELVERYAWFISRRPLDGPFVKTSANLFDIHKSELTKLGEYYNSYDHEGND